MILTDFSNSRFFMGVRDLDQHIHNQCLVGAFGGWFAWWLEAWFHGLAFSWKATDTKTFQRCQNLS